MTDSQHTPIAGGGNSSPAAPVAHEQQVVEDHVIVRDRAGRAYTAIGLGLAAFFVPTLLGGLVTKDWWDYAPIGGLLGALVGWTIFYHLAQRVVVEVNFNRGFITVDNFGAFLGRPKSNVVYGPGLHLAYPWEQREESGNISYDEASEPFVHTVSTKSGPVTVEGSYRVRPRSGTKEPIIFRGGAAVAASEIGDFIKESITGELDDKTAEEARSYSKKLNENLQAKFKHGPDGSPTDDRVSALEERFAIVIGDVTIAKISLSAESEKTRAGIDEAKIIAKGTAILMGFSDDDEKSAEEKLEEARAAGKVRQDDILKFQNRFLAASDNIKMNLDSNEYTISFDAPDELVGALATLGPALIPLIQALKKQGGGGNGKKKGGK